MAAGKELHWAILWLSFAIGYIGAVVRFAPGINYQYRFKGEQMIERVAAIKVDAQVTISVYENFAEHQLCHFQVKTYKLLINNDGVDREPHTSDLNFTNSFLFEIWRSGEVSKVLYPQRSDPAIVALQKMLLASLSAKLMLVKESMEEGYRWGYQINETGHEGEHVAAYKAENKKGSIAFIKTRATPTLKNAKEHYVKEIHYSPGLHVPHHIKVKSNFTSPTHSAQGYHAKDGMGNLIRENHPDEVSTMEIPGMHTSSQIEVTLLSTARMPQAAVEDVDIDALIVDSVKIGKIPLPKTGLENLRGQIYGNISCLIKAYKKEDKSSPCFHQLVEALEGLGDGDLTILTTQMVQHEPLDIQAHFLDGLAALETNHTQELLVQHVLDVPHPNPDLVMRTLVQFVDLKYLPSKKLVDVLQKKVFEEAYSFSDPLVTQQVNDRCVLILGAVMNKVKQWDPKTAGQVVQRLQHSLGVHDPHKHREKRAVMEERDYHDMVQRQAIYLWTLGNAAMDSSYEHIISYVNHTDSPILWRRGAVHSIAKFIHEKAASDLLLVAVSDEDEDVRRAAIQEYKLHPYGVDMTPFVNKEGGYHKNATQMLQHRLRRSLEDVAARIWKGFHFNLKSPSVDWRKVVGSQKIGASFGVIIKNLIDILIRPLSGHLEVDVHDGAWVTAHLGILGFDYHLFKGEVCFKGKIEYELNILKEYGFDSIKEYAVKFGKVAKEVYNTIKDTVNIVKGLITSVKNLSLGDIFNKFVEVLKQLPKKVFNFPKIGKRIMQVLSQYTSLPPVVEKVKEIIENVKTLFKDIKNDVTNFYNTIADSVTVTLPWAWDEFKAALNDIIEAIGRILKNPKRAINDIGRSATRIFTAVGSAIDVKDKLLQLNFFKKENRPYWFDVKGVVLELWEDVMEVRDELNKTISWLQTSPDLDEIAKKYTGVDLRTLRQHVLREIRDLLLEELEEPFAAIKDIFQPVLDIYELFTDGIKNVKEAWTKLKLGYEHARTLIDITFGMKMDKAFPRKYLESTSCGDGFYKSTGRGSYDHPGVDAEAQIGQEIVAPFEGNVTISGLNQVTIKIQTARNMICILENVKLYDHLNAQLVGAGQPIGVVTKPSWCSDGHVHVAILKLGKEGGYIDPSRHMERRDMPDPTWRQECDHYILIWKNNVISQGHLAGGPDKKDQTPQIPDAPDLSQLNVELLPIDDAYKIRKKRFLDGFIKNLDEFVTNLGLPNVTGLKDLLNLRFDKITLGQLFDFLDKVGMSGLKNSAVAIMEKIDTVTNGKVCVRPEDMDIEDLKKTLVLRGLTTHGAKKTLVQRYLDSQPSCFGGQGHLNKAMYCTFDSSCTSFSCCVDLSFFTFRHSLLLFVNFDPCQGILTLGVNEWTTTVDIFDENFDTTEKTTVLSMEANIAKLAQLTLVYRIVKEYDKVQVSMGVSWCSSKAEVCQPLIELVKEVPLSLAATCSSSSPSTAVIERRDAGTDLASLKKMNLGEILKLIEISDLDGELIEQIMEDLREAFQRWMRSQIEQLIVKVFGNEFKLFDMCTKGYHHNFGPYSTVFFDYAITIPVGPIPLLLRFGAGGQYGAQFSATFCVMSMTATARLTPGVGASVWGGVGVRLFVLTAELRLTGYLLNTHFPTKVIVEFHKFPMEVRARMDLHLVPLRLELRAMLIFEIKIKIGWVKIHIRKVLINVLLWQYSTPAIQKNIFNINDAEPDDTPPKFIGYVKSKCSNCENGEDGFPLEEKYDKEFVRCYNCSGDGTWKDVRKRDLSALPHTHKIITRATGNAKCRVMQMKGRDHTEPAFHLELDVDDDRSEVDLDLCVGSSPGACDVVNHEPLGGTGTYSKRLISGVPVYFTVCGKNSAGGKSCTTCNLPTYDTTLPGGRVMPAFLTSSHPNVIKGSALATDDSVLEDKRIAAGYGRGISGDQIIHFQPVTVRAGTRLVDLQNDPLGLKLLQHFASPRQGKLVSSAFRRANYLYAEACARDCLNLPTYKCLGFNYDYGTSGQCELLQEVEGHGVERHVSGSFHYFERLGIGHQTSFEFRDVALGHNQIYFFNFYLKNVMQYQNILSSRGMLVDLTPPMPGHLENVTMDVMNHEPCLSFIPDKYKEKCVDQTPHPNYRFIIDGPGSTTVGNGPTHGIDLRYTRASRMAGAHWDGIYDNETDILVYTWALGTAPCKSDVHPHHDPHDHLSDASEWTHTGVIFPLKLADGNYHVVVQALNKIDYGGPMALGVCHSQPYTVDTTPPLLYEIADLQYDDVSQVITFTYNGTDPLSGIMRTEFGLGRSKRDTYLLAWEPAPAGSPMSYNYKIPDGVPAWVKLRLTNHVELRTAGHADHPILVDTSPPIAGVIMDGQDHQKDLVYQASTTTICAAWKDFYDPDSGILEYSVGVGTEPGTDNVVSFESVSHYTSHGCWSASLQHKQTYYSTVTAFHGGHKKLNVTASSDGVMVDATPPISGSANDSLPGQPDIQFSSQTASAAVSWTGFSDPESGLVNYKVTFLRKPAGTEKEKEAYSTSLPATASQLSVHSLRLHHQDFVRVAVTATNGAGSSITVHTDGFLVDLTEPIMHELSDGPKPYQDIEFTSSLTTLSATWNYTDAESDLHHIKLAVYETRGGSKKKLFPSTQWKELTPESKAFTTDEPLQLELGLHYQFKVGAVNRALLTATHETDGVVPDNTPPEMLFVHAGVIDGESEELEDGYIIHVKDEGIWASWMGVDYESGVEAYFVAVGTTQGGTDIQDFQNVGERTNYFVSGVHFQLTNPVSSSPVYYISVKCVSGAGMESNVQQSSPIKIVEGDQAGVVYDGPSGQEDLDVQLDPTTITASFHGFQSARDGIAHYEWAVGTRPFSDDVLAYTQEGIVEDEIIESDEVKQVYHAEMLLPLTTGVTYFTSIRAITGARNMLESSSNGITIDTTPPEARFTQVGPEGPVVASDVIFQKEADSLVAAWNISDPQGLASDVQLTVGSYPESMEFSFKKTVPPVGQLGNAEAKPYIAGLPSIITLHTHNLVNLENSVYTTPIVVDQTAPEDGTVSCPAFVSGHVDLTCSWSGFKEQESTISHYQIGLGEFEGDDSLVTFQQIPAEARMHVFKDLISQQLKHGKKYFVTVVAVNRVGLVSTGAVTTVAVDHTPPKGGQVVELADTAVWDEFSSVTEKPKQEDLSKLDSTCQKSTSQLKVAFEPFTDQESDVVRYEVGVGTSPGGTQIQDFEQVESGVFQVFLEGLDLLRVSQVFATIKAYNGAGQHTTATSNGVYISRISAGLEPLQKSMVLDGDSPGRDLDYQDHNDGVSAQWDLRGDPCPAAKLEWAVQRADGKMLIPFMKLDKADVRAESDELEMRDGETFFSILRVTNLLGYTYSIRSDGITVQVEPLLPGHVRDGPIIGFDLNYQPSVTKLSANWDGFGKESDANLLQNLRDLEAEIGIHQAIDHYEVAVGTDRRYPTTRDNIHPFTNVGLNTSWTFEDLTLTPKTATYYVTVRTYGVSTAVAEVTSNGIQVGHGAHVITKGEVQIKKYVASSEKVDLSWSDFVFVEPVIFYQYAIGTYSEELLNISCTDMENGQNTKERTAGKYSHLFDVQPLTTIVHDTYVTIKGLTLAHGGHYHVAVIATDLTGGCIMATAKFTVDTSPPVQGQLQVSRNFGKSVLFVHDANTLSVSWTGFKDPESGITKFEILLVEGNGCTAPNIGSKEADFISLLPNMTSHTFMDLELQPAVTYYLYLRSTNGAGTSTLTVSKPLLLDPHPPVAGTVIDGTDLLKDRKFQSSLTDVKGSLLYLASPTVTSCPHREYSMQEASSDWQTAQTRGINGDWDSKVIFQHKQVTYLDGAGVEIKLSRDVQGDRMLGAALYTEAHLATGGTYQFFLRAAEVSLKAVTSVSISNAPQGQVWEYQEDAEGSTAAANGQVQDGVVIPDQLPGDTANIQLPFTYSDLRGFGIQLRQGEGKPSTMLVWVKNKNESFTVPVELNFDPAADFHEYRLVVNEDEPNPTDNDWILTVYIDGQMKAYMSGVPPLTSGGHMRFHIWNDQEFVPELNDPFHAPSTSVVIKNVKLPADSMQPCRFVQPFRGGGSPVEAVYAGVGTEPNMVDAVPFRQVTPPCIPCTSPCLECDQGCSLTAPQELHVHLDNLSLEMPEDNGGNDTQLALYYLTIKTVTGSGQEAIASSNGLYLDNTPPEVTSLFHVDLSWSQQEPSEYQGSNDSIACLWEAHDRQSEIVEYLWAIGSSPGASDIQHFTSNGKQTFAFNRQLAGKLQNGQTYYVTVKAVNQAGLVGTRTSTGVTVLLETPDESSTQTSVADTEPFNKTDGTTSAVKSSKQDGLSVTYDQPRNTEGVDGIYVSLGTKDDGSPEGSDIFPERQVGYNTSGSVEIGSQGVSVSGENVGALSDVRDKTGRTKRAADSGFLMEPGRSIYIKFKLCNQAHKCGYFNNKAVLIMRDKDKKATTEAGTKLAGVLRPSGPSLGDIKFRTVSEQPKITTVVYGELTKDDLKQHYKSDASNKFKPYIIDPEASMDQTDRFLHKRITEWSDTSFYLTPLPGESIEGSLQVTVPYDTVVYSQEQMKDKAPRLLMWNPDNAVWIDASSACPPNNQLLIYDQQKGLMTVNVCANTGKGASSRSKRGTTSAPITGPTQFTVGGVSTTFVNTPPTLTSPKEYSMFEDTGTVQIILQGTDAENDDIYFRIDSSYQLPLGGNASISLLSGSAKLYYRPCENCYGIEIIRVQLIEKRIDNNPALVTDADITVKVLPQNDNPVLFLVSSLGILDVPDPDTSLEWTVEQNTAYATKLEALWVILGAYDVDGTDSLNIKVTNVAHGNTSLLAKSSINNFNKTHCLSGDAKAKLVSFIQDAETAGAANSSSSLPVPCTLTQEIQSSQVGFHALVLQYTPGHEFYGQDHMEIIAEDEYGGRSRVLTVDIYVLEAPCQNNASCVGPPQDRFCQDKQRASGFASAGYTCACAPGYNGTYCDVDIDECASSPCPQNTSCVDGINSYLCYCGEGWPCNPSPPAGQWWLAAAVAAPGAALIFIAVFVLLYKCLSKRSNPPSSDKQQLRANSASSNDRSSGTFFAPFLRNFWSTKGNDPIIYPWGNTKYGHRRAWQDVPQSHHHDHRDMRKKDKHQKNKNRKIHPWGDSEDSGYAVGSDPLSRMSSFLRETKVFSGNNSHSAEDVHHRAEPAPDYGRPKKLHRTSWEIPNF